MSLTTYRGCTLQLHAKTLTYPKLCLINWASIKISQKTMQSNLSLRTPLYYGQFTWSPRDWNPYKAYFSKTDTSIIRGCTLQLHAKTLTYPKLCLINWASIKISQKTMQSNLSLRTPLHYGQFTWSPRDWNPYKAYFSKTDTSIIRRLIPVPLMSVIKRFDCTRLKLPLCHVLFNLFFFIFLLVSINGSWSFALSFTSWFTQYLLLFTSLNLA